MTNFSCLVQAFRTAELCVDNEYVLWCFFNSFYVLNRNCDASFEKQYVFLQIPKEIVH